MEDIDLYLLTKYDICSVTRMDYFKSSMRQILHMWPKYLTTFRNFLKKIIF